VIKKEDEKILKYEELIIEVQVMWNVKAKVIRVIIGATTVISKLPKQILSNIPGKHEIKEIQKKKKQPYWALNTYCGKCYCKSTTYISRAK
jgi:hypothetical protein